MESLLSKKICQNLFLKMITRFINRNLKKEIILCGILLGYLIGKKDKLYVLLRGNKKIDEHGSKMEKYDRKKIYIIDIGGIDEIVLTKHVNE